MDCLSNQRLRGVLSTIVLSSLCLGGCQGDSAQTSDTALGAEGLTRCDDPESEFPALFNRAMIEKELAQTPDLASSFGSKVVNTCGEALRYRDLYMDYESNRPAASNEPSDSEVYPSEPHEKIHVGTTVNGAGPSQQWEGIVLIETYNGSKTSWCTATFITGQHLYTAAHCFGAGPGSQTVSYFAPTLGWVTKSANVSIPSTYSDGHRSDDIAIVRLSSAEAWANTSRRFRLYTGGTTVGTGLQIYGYGNNAYNGTGAGTFRVGKDHTAIRLADHQDGYFRANANTARVCHGDSGGPAIKEGSMAIVWGTSTKFKSAHNDNCPHTDEDMFWTKTTTNISYIEGVLGFACSRFTGDNQTYARCW